MGQSCNAFATTQSIEKEFDSIRSVAYRTVQHEAITIPIHRHPPCSSLFPTIRVVRRRVVVHRCRGGSTTTSVGGRSQSRRLGMLGDHRGPGFVPLREGFRGIAEDSVSLCRRKQEVRGVGRPRRMQKQSAIHAGGVPKDLLVVHSAALGRRGTNGGGRKNPARCSGTSVRNAKLPASAGKEQRGTSETLCQQRFAVYALVVHRGMREQSPVYADRVRSGVSNVLTNSSVRSIRYGTVRWYTSIILWIVLPFDERRNQWSC